MGLLLLLLILVPLVVAVGCLLVPKGTARMVAFVGSFIELGLAIALFRYGFENGPTYAPEWLTIGGLNTGVRLGIGPISYWLVLLTAILMPLAIWSSFDSIKTRQGSYYFWLMALVMPMMGTFLARDGLLFYVFFELTLVPMFFLIGIWGAADLKRKAAVKFFLYTFVGGVFTLGGVLYLGLTGGSFDMTTMAATGQAIDNPTLKVVLFFALLIGLAVKVPLFPVHTWLPLAHTVAPTAGSVILAGVLLKLGTYGILTIAIPMGLLSNSEVGGAIGLLPVMRDAVIPLIAILAIIGIVYGALIAWVQTDVKKLVAYSSVSHLGFCVLGLFALNLHGVQGSVLYMLNHGISTGALFLMIGMIYDRYHTREFRHYGGLGKVMPVFSFFLVLFAMSSIGLPGTNGFVSEFLTIFGAFQSPVLGWMYGAFAALGVILGAVYMLHMVAELVFGPTILPETHDHGHASDHAFDDTAADHAHDDGHHTPEAKDLTTREILILTPLAILVIYLGVMPTPLLSSIEEQSKWLLAGDAQSQVDARSMADETEGLELTPSEVERQSPEVETESLTPDTEPLSPETTED